MIVYSRKVLEGGISGQGSSTALVTSQELNAMLAQAERFYVQARVAQVTGTAPKVTIEIQTSNDGNTWSLYATPISSIDTPINVVTPLSGSGVDAAKVVGSQVRILAYFSSGTNPNANIEVWVTGRAD